MPSLGDSLLSRLESWLHSQLDYFTPSRQREERDPAEDPEQRPRRRPRDRHGAQRSRHHVRNGAQCMREPNARERNSDAQQVLQDGISAVSNRKHCKPSDCQDRRYYLMRVWIRSVGATRIPAIGRPAIHGRCNRITSRLVRLTRCPSAAGRGSAKPRCAPGRAAARLLQGLVSWPLIAASSSPPRRT